MINYFPKSFYKFCLVFFAVFFFFFFGFKLVYGIATPGGTYSPFVEKYFNLASWVRHSLMNGTKFFVSLVNIKTIIESEYVLRAESGSGIKLIYGCLGIGVYSFWAAYSIATITSIKNKLKWLFFGLTILWILNILRLGLVLIASVHNWEFPFGIDHHTWFNIVAYSFILAMIYFFERNIKTTTNRNL